VKLTRRTTAGRYNFGYIDHDAYIGNVSYSNVTDDYPYWMFNTSGYAVGDRRWNEEQLQVITDTGTTLVLMPEAVVGEYWGAVRGADWSSHDYGFIFPCTAELPDFILGTNTSLTEKHEPLRIPGALFNFGPANKNGTCFGGMQPSFAQFGLLGDVALKASFVVHEQRDGVPPRVGFAAKNITI
jgi:hypothetical protein